MDSRSLKRWLSPFLFRHGLRRATFPPGEGIFAGIVDSLANSRKLPGHFQIGKAQDFETLGGKLGSTLQVFLLPGGIIVLRAVQLYHKPCLMAVEIRNVIANDILPAKTHRVFLQEIMPKEIFFLCLVFS